MVLQHDHYISTGRRQKLNVCLYTSRSSTSAGLVNIESSITAEVLTHMGEEPGAVVRYL